MTALVIEDGTGKPDANSYATLDQVRAFANARGIKLPDDDETLTEQLITAADFIGTYETRFSGNRSYPQNPQALSFPRDNVYMYQTDMPQAFMPRELIGAQVYVCEAIANGIELYPTQDGADVVRETVGPITTEYQQNTWTASSFPIISAVEAILNPLFGGNGYKWRTVRV